MPSFSHKMKVTPGGPQQPASARLSVFEQEEDDPERQIALCLLEVLYSVIRSVQRIETDAEFRRELDVVTTVRVTEYDELKKKF